MELLALKTLANAGKEDYQNNLDTASAPFPV